MNPNINVGRIRLAGSFAMAAACALVASQVFAQAIQVRSETVHFADLNTDTPSGVAALYGRIHAAARRVCAVSGERDLARARLAADCAARAEAAAIDRLDLPKLTAFYREKTGGGGPTITANR
jgi:UrcA family protein